jgi:organic hydroperoxide reductase OsmC/OhrA
MARGGEHTYEVIVEWTGNRGTGTSDYRSYGREHTISAGGKPSIPGSSDAAFRGDPARWNPEELLVASLSTCHKLWYLHLCADAGIHVLAYRDAVTGTMLETADGGGHFSRVVLRPHVTVRTEDDVDLARHLHGTAHAKCFIANSVNFPVEHEPVIVREGQTE